MRRSTTQRLACGLVLAGATVAALMGPVTSGAAAAVAQPTETTVVGAPATSTPAVEVTEQESVEIGDPAADRRIRFIVITLLALAVLVLVTTILFWRATRPVPRPLARLGTLGTRAGRRRALAAEPSPAADGADPVAEPQAASLDAPEVARAVEPVAVPAAGELGERAAVVGPDQAREPDSVLVDDGVAEDGVAFEDGDVEDGVATEVATMLAPPAVTDRAESGQLQRPRGPSAPDASLLNDG